MFGFSFFRNIFIIVLLFLSVSNLLAENKKTDSLKTVFYRTSADTARARVALKIAREFLQQSPDSATNWINKAFSVAGEKNASVLAEANSLLGELYERKNLYDRALEYFQRAIEYASSLKDSSFLANLYNKTGNAYKARGNYEKSLEYHQRALELYSRLKDSLNMAFAYNTLGLLNYEQGNYNRALEYFFKSLSIYKKQGNEENLAIAYANIASIYHTQGAIRKAIDNYFNSLRTFEKIGHKFGIAACYINLGHIYLQQEEPEKALKNHFKALQILKELKDKNALALCYNSIGDAYKALNKSEKAYQYYEKAITISKESQSVYHQIVSYHNIGVLLLEQKKFQEALKYLNKGYVLALRSGNKSLQAGIAGALAELYFFLKKDFQARKFAKEAYGISKEIRDITIIQTATEILSKLEERSGNYKQALKYYKEFIQARDSIKKEDHQHELLRKELQYQYEKERAVREARHKAELEKQKLFAENQRKRQNIIITAISVILGLFAIFMGILFTRYKIIRKQKNIIEEQNALLQKQKEKLEVINKELEQKNEEIRSQSEKLQLLNYQLASKNRALTDSIYYASRIQNALLKTSDYYLRKSFFKHFLLYLPRDIVSGDFYWCYKKGESIYIAVADCTGHGVPGALISMLGMEFLFRIVESSDPDTATILEHLQRAVAARLNPKGTTDIKDGMDISLLKISEDGTAQWSGANNPLYIITRNSDTYNSVKEKAIERASQEEWTLLEIRPDKQSVAYAKKIKRFTRHQFQWHKGDILVMFSDGFPDQFGGVKNRKFGYKRFRQMLLHLTTKKELHTENFLEILKKWQGDEEQIDDITLLGILL